MSKVNLFFFYLLILLLPTQLGRHFFFNFSFISGVRSDYLAPTVFLTDTLVFLIISFWLLNFRKKTIEVIKKYFYPFLLIVSFLLYLFFNSIFVAQNQPVAIYKLVKIVEFMLLGFYIVNTRPNKKRIFILLATASVFQAIIAIFQFINQGSIGGLFWWLGERSFYLLTPGIARFSYSGEQLLRPYATFPHPNVLGGFLAIVLTGVIYHLLFNGNSFFNKIVFYLSLILGSAVLLLIVSRSSWLAFIIGLLFIISAKIYKLNVMQAKLKKHYHLVLSSFYLTILLSVVVFLTYPFEEQSLIERATLSKTAINFTATSPLFGIGLNNFITRLANFSQKQYNFFFFQPVHNIYLLTLAELGLLGFSFLLLFLAIMLRQALRNSFIVAVLLIEFYLFGLFDHYLFTLQQGMLLFTVIASLAFLPKDR